MYVCNPRTYPSRSSSGGRRENGEGEREEVGWLWKIVIILLWRIGGTWRLCLRLSSSFGAFSSSILTSQTWEEGVTCTTNNCRRVLNLIHRPTSLPQLVTAVKDNRIRLRLSGHDHAAAAVFFRVTGLHFPSQLLEVGECVEASTHVVPALLVSCARPFSEVIL